MRGKQEVKIRTMNHPRHRPMAGAARPAGSAGSRSETQLPSRSGEKNPPGRSRRERRGFSQSEKERNKELCWGGVAGIFKGFGFARTRAHTHTLAQPQEENAAEEFGPQVGLFNKIINE